MSQPAALPEPNSPERTPTTIRTTRLTLRHFVAGLYVCPGSLCEISH